MAITMQPTSILEIDINNVERIFLFLTAQQLRTCNSVQYIGQINVGILS
jgi:hypothetical protein